MVSTTYTHIQKLTKTYFRGCLAISLYENQGFRGWFYLIFVIIGGFLSLFYGSRFLLIHEIDFFSSQFFGIYRLIPFCLRKDKIQGLHESQRKAYCRVFRVLGEVSHDVQGFHGPLDSLQGFLGSARQISIVVAFPRQISILFSL